MSTNQYLAAVLRDQDLTEDGGELRKLREHREKVEALLRREFMNAAPSIRYGGSKAKGTMNRASFDLDIACYFPHGQTGAGETLKEIYENSRAALQKEYLAESKTSAIRLKDPADAADFHIDVIPGRFVVGDDGDVYIYQASAEKCRLKTNLDVHIAKIRDSGVTDAIRLMKLWNAQNHLGVKTFVLELLTVELLHRRKESPLEDQVRHVWAEFRDSPEGLSVEDPANPAGNDLSGYLDAVRFQLPSAAREALRNADSDNWTMVFGEVQTESKAARIESLRRVAATVSAPAKPWWHGR